MQMSRAIRKTTGTLLAALLFGLLAAVPAYAQTTPPPLKYEAYGASSTRGYKALPAYPTIFGEYAASDLGQPVETNITTRDGSGATYWAWKFQTKEVRKKNRNARIITIMAGRDEIQDAAERYHDGTCWGSDGQNCLRRAVRTLTDKWTTILKEMDAANANDDKTLRIIGLYMADVTQLKSDGEFEVIRDYYIKANEWLYANAPAYGVTPVRTQEVFNGPEMDKSLRETGFGQQDDEHLNEAGQQRMAELLRSYGY